MDGIARYLGGAQFEFTARGHRVICDQPLDNDGSDKGMSPPEFLLAALATCAAYYATQYLNTRQLPAENLTVRVSAEKASHPAHLASFLVEVMAPGLEERHQAGVLRAVRACMVHNTLLGGPVIEVLVNPPEHAQPRAASQPSAVPMQPAGGNDRVQATVTAATGFELLPAEQPRRSSGGSRVPCNP